MKKAHIEINKQKVSILKKGEVFFFSTKDISLFLGFSSESRSLRDWLRKTLLATNCESASHKGIYYPLEVIKDTLENNTSLIDQRYAHLRANVDSFLALSISDLQEQLSSATYVEVASGVTSSAEDQRRIAEEQAKKEEEERQEAIAFQRDMERKEQERKDLLATEAIEAKRKAAEQEELERKEAIAFQRDMEIKELERKDYIAKQEVEAKRKAAEQELEMKRIANKRKQEQAERAENERIEKERKEEDRKEAKRQEVERKELEEKRKAEAIKAEAENKLKAERKNEEARTKIANDAIIEREERQRQREEGLLEQRNKLVSFFSRPIVLFVPLLLAIIASGVDMGVVFCKEFDNNISSIALAIVFSSVVMIFTFNSGKHGKYFVIGFALIEAMINAVYFELIPNDWLVVKICATVGLPLAILAYADLFARTTKEK